MKEEGFKRIGNHDRVTRGFQLDGAFVGVVGSHNPFTRIWLVGCHPMTMCPNRPTN